MHTFNTHSFVQAAVFFGTLQLATQEPGTFWRPLKSTKSSYQTQQLFQIKYMPNNALKPLASLTLNSPMPVN
jgi:hypothetical protein